VTLSEKYRVPYGAVPAHSIAPQLGPVLRRVWLIALRAFSPRSGVSINPKGVRMLRWITLARSWPMPVRIGIATIAVAAATALQMPVGAFPGEPFLLYFVAVVASAGVLGRAAGFVAVAETRIVSLLYHEPVYSQSSPSDRPTWNRDLRGACSSER
jgi:hypothetical protein